MSPPLALPFPSPWPPLLLLVLFHSVLLSDFPPAPLANSVLADPRVDCGVESISVWIRTEKPFRGRLYVEDESEQPECVHSYAVAGEDEQGRGPAGEGNSRGAQFSIRFGQCNMRRQRLLNPRGVTYSFTLVISFHPVFLTGIDRAFNIKCFFLEAVRALDTSVDVSPLSTSVVEREFTLPQCTYHLRHALDGPSLKYASIGEPVTHVWQCDPVAGWLYGVLVHSCFVDDGHGNRFDLVDDRGCVIDRSLLSNIQYDEKAFSAFAHAHVFRYADRVQLFFTCTVQLCFREDGGCEGISPPQCDAPPGPGDPHLRLLHSAGPPLPPLPRPPGLDRNFRKPPDNGDGVPPFGRPFRSDSPFGTRSPPFKDSPLEGIGNATGVDGAHRLVDKVRTSATNHSRAGREGRDAGELGRMEADLSADLTVVPRTKESGEQRGTEEEEGGTGAVGGQTDPFVRALPIKREQYSPLAPHLDSQRFGSFEMLTIVAVSFGATITVTSVITSICLHRCRMKRMMGEKFCRVGP